MVLARRWVRAQLKAVRAALRQSRRVELLHFGAKVVLRKLRLDLRSSECFLRVTAISNRQKLRLEIATIEGDKGDGCPVKALR